MGLPVSSMEALDLAEMERRYQDMQSRYDAVQKRLKWAFARSSASGYALDRLSAQHLVLAADHELAKGRLQTPQGG